MPNPRRDLVLLGVDLAGDVDPFTRGLVILGDCQSFRINAGKIGVIVSNRDFHRFFKPTVRAEISQTRPEINVVIIARIIDNRDRNFPLCLERVFRHFHFVIAQFQLPAFVTDYFRDAAAGIRMLLLQVFLRFRRFGERPANGFGRHLGLDR